MKKFKIGDVVLLEKFHNDFPGVVIRATKLQTTVKWSDALSAYPPQIYRTESDLHKEIIFIGKNTSSLIKLVFNCQILMNISHPTE